MIALSHGIEVQSKNNLERWHDLLLKAVNSYSFQCQGELTVSNKPEAAFAFAAVIEALCADFPDFGHLNSLRSLVAVLTLAPLHCRAAEI
jgi:hypothetical protein